MGQWGDSDIPFWYNLCLAKDRISIRNVLDRHLQELGVDRKIILK
jgi:hypothetical protein